MTTDSASSTEGKARSKRWFGVFGQLVVFTVIWAVLVTILGLVAIAPTILVNGWRVASEPGESLGPSSPTILLVSVSTALATTLAIWLMHRFFHGPALLDLGLRPRPGWVVAGWYGALRNVSACSVSLVWAADRRAATR